MAGKNAKRRAEAGKSGVRFLDLSRDMWKMLANVSLMADVLGAHSSLAEKCRALSARAEYFLEKPEDKRGLVRGELTNEEWTAFVEVVEKFGDASPPLRAFARSVGGRDARQTITFKKLADDQDKQMQQDAAVVSNPASLRFLIRMLDFMVLRFDWDAVQRLMPNGEYVIPKQKTWKRAKDGAGSAREKLNTLLEDILRPDGRTTAPLMLNTLEARSVCYMFALCKDVVYAGAEVPPDLKQDKKKAEHLLGDAVRFFDRIADEGEAIDNQA